MSLLLPSLLLPSCFSSLLTQLCPPLQLSSGRAWRRRRRRHLPGARQQQWCPGLLLLLLFPRQQHRGSLLRRSRRLRRRRHRCRPLHCNPAAAAALLPRRQRPGQKASIRRPLPRRRGPSSTSRRTGRCAPAAATAFRSVSFFCLFVFFFYLKSKRSICDVLVTRSV